MDTYEKIHNYTPKMDCNNWDNNLKDFIKRILNKNGQKRITVNEMKYHKWITNNNKIDILKQPSFVKLNKNNNKDNTDNSSNDDKKEDRVMQSANSVNVDNNDNDSR